MPDVQATKQLSARRQIEAAIRHLYANELESAITLAGAAEGQLPETTKDYLFRILKRHFGHDELNAVRDWLKHPAGQDAKTITEFDAALMISRAIQKFVAVYEAAVPAFVEFSAWAVEHGHMPGPIIVDGRAGAAA